MPTLGSHSVRTPFKRIAVLAVFVIAAMLPLAGPAAASDRDQWDRYTDANGFVVLAWYQCSDGIANVAVVFLYEDVKDHAGWGNSRKFCLNAGDRSITFRSFCEDVPGERWEALPLTCGTAFDDSFNDRTSFVRIAQMSGSASVRLCKNAGYHAPCLAEDDRGDKDFSDGGRPGPSWNDTISSMWIRQ